MPHQLTKENVGSFLKRFDGFDGAVFLRSEYISGVRDTTAKLVIELSAYDTSITSEIPSDCMVSLELILEGQVQFRLTEHKHCSNTVLNYEIVSFYHDKILYLNFDPLGSKDINHEHWTIEEITNSSFFIGSETIGWSIKRNRAPF